MTTREQRNIAYPLMEEPFQYPGMPLRPRFRQHFRLWIYPSFQPCVSFSIGNEGKEYYLRRVVWAHRLTPLTLEPQTYCCETAIGPAFCTEMAGSLSKLSFSPFVPSRVFGIDGVRYGIEFNDMLYPVRLSWWSTPPAGWEALGNWHKRFRLKINAMLPQTTIDITAALDGL